MIARPPIRADFFATYPTAVGSQLDVLPSDSNHCGVCHFDFAGGGPRNPYGLAIEVGRNNGLTNVEAILAIEGEDTDNDGYSNLVEITDMLFDNTPTFPGLNSTNASSTSNIPLNEILGYLTPEGSADSIPPVVVVNAPDGGESIQANELYTVLYSATDENDVGSVNIYMSDDGGTTFKPVATGLANTGSYSWFVPNLPGGSTRVRVEAIDNAGNPGSDLSDNDFTVLAVTGGYVPTTLRDIHFDGRQPHEGVTLVDVEANCYSCHEDYNDAVEPGSNWEGSPMAQAARDPLFLAALAIAEQDAPSVGDLCLRCHTPGGWMEGRSVDTSGGMLTAKDRQSINCDFCHRLVDYNYVEGVSPSQDQDVLAAVVPLPLQYGNGQFIADPAPLRRGPYADANASHDFVESPFHRESDLCGTCHDVSNPVFDEVAPGKYVPNGFDDAHATMATHDMLPIERTFSEWSMSEYASTGVYAPQFAGNKASGIVSTCQDCHMRDVAGKGCNVGGAPNRSDLPLHDFMGGNTFLPDILPALYPGEVDSSSLQEAKLRARTMLQLAATLEVTPSATGIDVRVINETGHKLPSGYPEGRRIWLQVEATDSVGTTVYSSGDYDPVTAVLTHDEDLKLYEIHPGLSPGLAGALGLPAGPSFHFVLNDSIYLDNRIPPRGFTNAAFEAVQSPPVAYSYADGEYWDDTGYELPVSADSVRVTLFYQSTSKEFVEFLRDANTTNTAGQTLYDAWVAQGMSPPEVMAETTLAVDVIQVAVDDEPTPTAILALLSPQPNPFRGATVATFSLPEAGPARIEVFDLAGRKVRTVTDGPWDAGRHEVSWDGCNDRGVRLAAGVYFMQLTAAEKTRSQRVVMLR